MAKIAIITGATGGLGGEFVRVINTYEEIDEIWAVGRNQEKLVALKNSYDKVVPLEADLTDGGTEQIVRKLEEEKPAVRLFVNNAGVGYLGKYETMDSKKVAETCTVNCTVPATLISVILPYMQEGAGILNISSASSYQPNPYLALYSASKVFLKNLSRALNVELKPRKIHVTAVCPGWIDTDMLPREAGGKKIKYTGIISAKKVVEKALSDNRKGKDMSTPGLFSKYFRFYSKVMPTAVVMKQWSKIVGKYV